MERKILILIFALALFIFAGCISYENTFKLNSDGSGTVEVHYWMSEQMYTMMMSQPPQEGEAPPEDPFSEAVVRRNYEGAGLTVSKYDTYKGDEEEPNRHVKVEISFKNISDLSNCNEFGKWSFTFEPKNEINFTAYLPSEEKPDSEMTEEEKQNRDQANQMLDAYTYKTIIHFPGKVTETNGEIDPKTPNIVTWTIKMSEMGKGVNYTAKIEQAGAKDKLLPLLIFAGFIILIIIIAVVAGGKKKGDVESAPSEE